MSVLVNFYSIFQHKNRTKLPKPYIVQDAQCCFLCSQPSWHLFRKYFSIFSFRFLLSLMPRSFFRGCVVRVNIPLGFFSNRFKMYDSRFGFICNMGLFWSKFFLDQVPNKSFSVLNPCQPWTKLEESRLWGSLPSCVHFKSSNLLQPSLPDDAYVWVFKPMLGCATDYFVISKRKGRSEMHFWMEFLKKTLRYYAVTCTFAMCMAHDVRHLRPVHNEATIYLGFLRTGSQFTLLIFLAKSQKVLHAHRKSIYAPDFSR